MFHSPLRDRGPVSYTHLYLIIIGFCEAFMAIELMTIGALSGLGMTKLCSIISIILTGARIPLAMLLTHAGMGLNGIWWALSLTDVYKRQALYNVQL